MRKLFGWAGKITRRGFLAGGAASLAAAAVGGKAMSDDRATPSGVESGGLNAGESRALVRFARDLFPHDRLPDGAYEKAIAPLLDEAARLPSTTQLLRDGLAQLDLSTTAASGKPYVGTADEDLRVAAIEKIESSAFFAKVYGDTITLLYNQPDLWAKFGYQGPSSALGGYLHRGFNDLEWL